MLDRAELSHELADMLGLGRPPVALAFVEEPPAGTPVAEGAVPSSCTFWIHADEGPFYAPADAHFNCPIGAMTMGFEMPEVVKDNLMGLVQMMGAEGYVSPDEPPSIPGVSKSKSGIVYGPLPSMPVDPDVIVMWLEPAEAMLYAEAAGAVKWSSDMPTAMFGRPTCAAIATAQEESRPTMSLGCIGMRAFTGIDANTMLAALPASAAEQFTQALRSTVAANAAMQSFYTQHKAQFVAG